MQPSLSETTLSQLSEFVARELGLYFPRERWRDLERGIRSAARGKEVEDYVGKLMTGPLTRPQIEKLASELTVGETYFFREMRSFEILEEVILPEITRKRHGAERILRIWSAGCCTGEEPYSIAILLDRVLPLASQWHVTILATDINPLFLQKAAAGIYGEWSFRNAPPWLKEKYFTRVADNRYQIAQHIRQKVTFEYLNLAEDTYPSLANNTNAMDLILCRNVLMYFSPELIRKVAEGYYRALVKEGWFIVSPTEVSSETFPQFASQYFEGAILYRKTANVRAAPVVAPAESPTAPLMDIPLPPPEAVVVFDEPEIIPEEIPAPKQMGETARDCANKGELGQALEWAEKALAADRLDAGLQYLRGIILQERGAGEEAVLALKRALYLDPDFVLAHFALGNVEVQRQRRREADRHFANALGLLARYGPGDVIPQSDGLAAGRLKQIIESRIAVEEVA